MAFKALLASVLLVQSALGQCLGRAAAPCGLAGGYGAGLSGGYGAGLAGGYGAGYAGGYGAGCGCGASGVASTGGGLPISSVSPIAPAGISVLSENAYEGQLVAGGNLPFLGGVAIEGVLPTAGTGAVSYGCGDGLVGIGNESPIYTGVATPGAIFPPSSPSPSATNAAVGLGLGGNAGYGVGGINGYGLGGSGYGLGGAGYGLGGAGYGYASAGCGCC